MSNHVSLLKRRFLDKVSAVLEAPLSGDENNCSTDFDRWTKRSVFEFANWYAGCPRTIAVSALEIKHCLPQQIKSNQEINEPIDALLITVVAGLRMVPSCDNM